MLQVLVQESAVGIAIIDRYGCIVRVNEALRRMVDHDCDLSPGQPAQDIFCSDCRHEVWEELAPALAGRRAPRAFVSMLRAVRGVAEHTVEVSAVALREADETISGAILQLSDITAQRRLEAQLAQSQKLQAVGQLAGGIAHDFNNLLTAVMGAAEDALSRAPSDAETVEDLEQIRSSAERGAALVRQLLAFGRQQTLQPRPVSINAAVESVSGLLRRLLGSTVRLELQLEQPGRMIRVDPTQLDQVLVNLAVNARDAMADGGQLTLRTGHITLYRPLGARRGDHSTGPLRDGRGAGHRCGHRARRVAAHLRSILHDPAGTGRQRAGVVDGAWHHPPVRRLPGRRQPGRQGHPGAHLPAALRRG